MFKNTAGGIKRAIIGLQTTTRMVKGQGMLLIPLNIIFVSGGALPYTRLARGEKNWVKEKYCEAVLNLVCEYCGDNKLKKKGM